MNEYIELLTDGKHGGVTLTENGIIFLKNSNIKEGIIDLTDLNFISEQESKETLRAEFKEKDILLTTIGTVGLSVVVPSNFPRATINQNLVRLVLKDKNKSNLISTFFNCYFGRKQILRLSAGNVYQMINYPNLRNIKIPLFSNNFQLEIENLVKTSYEKLEDSKKLYKQAEELLLKELDLLNFTSSSENIAIKSFKDSFLSSGRLDSEYYQPKYDEIIDHIKKVKFEKLNNIVKFKKSIEPGSEVYQDSGIPFIRVSNLTKFEISDTNIYLPHNIVKKEDLEKLYTTKDTILLSKDGTVGIAYKIKNELDTITSGAILHLNIKQKNILPEYLTLVLNSVIVQLQAQRDSGGSIIKHWKPSEIEEILIPILDISIQNEIEEKIKKSFELKDSSKKLLDLAKKVVEVAIEEDEVEAIKIINRIKL